MAFGLGAGTSAGFILLRATNLYGDPAPWTVHDSWSATVLSFLNCEKYPPSFLYLMMTLGPALLLLAAFDDVRGPIARWLVTFGRVPFFYYVAHIFLIHLLAVDLRGGGVWRRLVSVRGGALRWQKPAGLPCVPAAVWPLWACG